MYQSDSTLFSAALEIEHQARAIPLLKETAQNNVTAVKKLIESGVDINLHAPGGGKTALHMAVERSLVPMVQMLLTKKADANAVTTRGFTPLHVAAQIGHAGLIRMLVKAGANINARCAGGCTPLHEAAAKGDLYAVTQLLRLKADYNAKDSRYFLTPAKLALINGHNDLADVLMVSMTYAQIFIQDIHYILHVAKNNFYESTEEYRFLNKLTQDISTIPHADDFYKAVSAAFQSPEYEDFKETLRPCRLSIIAAMKQYNDEKREAAKDNVKSTTTSTTDGTNSTAAPAAQSTHSMAQTMTNNVQNITSPNTAPPPLDTNRHRPV